tara:strand:- start:174 stop:950 length:777 start_codon:yes stop_codon:yes gene_type:complete
VSKPTNPGSTRRFAALLGGAALALGVPSSVLAIGLLNDGDALASVQNFAAFTPADADPQLAELVAERGGATARLMRFTPAGRAAGNERAVTVAVRIDSNVAQAISVRSTNELVVGRSTTSIAPTRYNLGLARGYNSFTQMGLATTAAVPAQQQATPSTQILRAEMPDLADFTPRGATVEEKSRFAARVELEDNAEANRLATRSPVDRSVDVAGSYRVLRNLDVTAGVRYEDSRERLSALPDIEALDNQAVYVGTQFRF